MRRSNSNQRAKVQRAPAFAAQALGDAARDDQTHRTTRYAPASPRAPVEYRDESVLVLTIGEVARLRGRA